jgi:hypothetical protein
MAGITAKIAAIALYEMFLCFCNCRIATSKIAQE